MRNTVDKSCISLRIKYFRFSKGYIALGIVNALHCQLNRMQVKCACSANASIYILYWFLIKMRKILASVL